MVNDSVTDRMHQVRQDWINTGKALGYLAIILSLGFGTYFAIYFWKNHNKNACTFISVIFAIITISSIIWLCGISLKKPKCMLISLIFWTIPLSICTVCASMYFLFLILHVMQDVKDRHYFRSSIRIVESLIYEAICVTFYSSAVMSYISIKNTFDNEANNPRLEMVYTAVPVKNQETNA